MDAASLLTGIACLGVALGWQPLPGDADSYECVVQISPELAQSLADGTSIPLAVEVPADIEPIGRFRLIVGPGEPARERRVTVLKPIIPAGDDGPHEGRQGIVPTQYTGPIGGAAAADTGRYRNPPAGNFDPYAKPSSITGRQMPTVGDNPPAEAVGAAVQDAAGRARVWADGQAAAVGNQIRGVTDDAAQQTGQMVGETLDRARQATPPAVQQLFGAGASATRQATAPVNGQSSRNGVYGQGRDAGSFLDRVGDGFERVVDPLRQGADRLQDRVGQTVENVGDRIGTGFDKLGRPIPYFADRDRSIFGGRRSVWDWQPQTAPPTQPASRSPADAQAAAGPRYANGQASRRQSPEAPATATRERVDQPYHSRVAADGRSSRLGGRLGADQRPAPTGVDEWPAGRQSNQQGPYFPGPRDSASRSDSATAGEGVAAGGSEQDPWASESPWPNHPNGEDHASPDETSLAGDDPPAIRREMLRGRPEEPLPNVEDEPRRAADAPTERSIDAPVDWKQPDAAESRLATSGERPSAADAGWDGRDRPKASEELAEAATEEKDATGTLGLLLAWLLLCGSIAANVYLFWSYLDVRNKYSSLVRKSARAVGSRFAAG